MGGTDEPVDHAASAIRALTSAIDAALAAVLEMNDRELAFQRATELWAQLRAGTDTNGQVRAILAAQVADANPGVKLEDIAARLSTLTHVVKKARAAELIETGRSILRNVYPA